MMRRAAWAISAGLLVANIGNAQCHNPPDIDNALKHSPTAEAYEALGAYFAKRNEIACALPAFEKAIKLKPESWEAHFNFGLALLGNNQPEVAATQFREAVKYNPSSIEAHNALATALEAGGHMDEAEVELNRSLRINPRSADTLARIGELYSSKHRYKAAVEKLSQAVAVSQDPELQIELAVAEANDGDAASAIRRLSELVHSHPALARAHFNLATVYADQKQFREAAQEYGATLRLEPDNNTARLSMAKAEATIADFTSALPVATEYVKRAPKDPEGHYILGTVYRGLAQYADAERELKIAVAGEDQYGPHYDLGFVLAKEGKPAEALRQLQRAVQLRPSASEPHFQLAKVYKTLGHEEEANKEMSLFRQEKQQSAEEDVASATGADANQLLFKGDPGSAAESYRKALSLDPNNAKTWYNLSLALGELGQPTDQRKALEKSIQLDPSLARAYNQLGLLDAAEGKQASAEEEFKKAISLDPQSAEAESNLGTLYGRTSRTKEAEALLRSATENDPKLVEASLNLGLILASEGNLAEAEPYLQSAVALAPENTAAESAFGMVETKLNKPDAAIRAFRKAVALQPQSAQTHLNLGIALADHFQIEEALREFTVAEQLSPDTAAPRYNRGRILADKHEYEDAVRELKLACERNPNFSAPFYLLGLSYTKLGNFAAAVKAFDEFVKLEPHSANAYFLAGRDLQRLGRSSDAIEYWKKAVGIDSGQTEALYSLWKELAKMGSPEAAAYEQRFKAIQHAKEIQTQSAMLGNFALDSAKRGDYQEAISQFQQALQECGDCQEKADLYKDLGLIECKSGDVGHGEQHLRMAQSLKPQDQDIAKALGIVHQVRKSP
jgi:tetratricopeptide (TPR) repeat protein